MNVTEHGMNVPVPHLRQALDLARQSIGMTEPNPRVGCVLVSADGTRVLGSGHTQAAGQAHAEVVALRDAAARAGQTCAGATAYVTLEPCAHHGRTGPCCDALVAAGIARVVASLEDPNPLVAGQGFARLRAAGMEVEVGPGRSESRELNIGFFSRMVRGRPWVRMKIAASLDGQTALANGQSQWITGEAARADGHAWRARAGAVLTGVGTVLEDDPRLDVRLAPTAGSRRWWWSTAGCRHRPRRPCSASRSGRCGSTPPRRSPQPRRRWKPVAPPSPTCPARAARWTSPPCWRTWPAAGSTSCTWRRASSSTAPAARGPGRRVPGVPGAQAAGPRPGRWPTSARWTHLAQGVALEFVTSTPSAADLRVLARPRTGRVLGSLRQRRGRPGGTCENARMFTGIITGVGRIAAVHDLGASQHGKRLAITETPPATWTTWAWRQHRAQRRLHDGHLAGRRRRPLHDRHLRRIPGHDRRPQTTPARSTWKRPCAPTTAWAATSSRATSTASAPSRVRPVGESWELRVAGAPGAGQVPGLQGLDHRQRRQPHGEHHRRRPDGTEVSINLIPTPCRTPRCTC